MNIRRLLSRVLWVIGIAVADVGLNAQTSVAPPVRTEVRFMSWEVDQEGLFITENDRDYTAITAPAYESGVPVSVRTAVPLRIYERIKNADGIVYVALGETVLPQACRTAQVYLIRRPDQDGRRNYQLIALSNDAEAFAAGTVRFFNFSPWPAAIRPRFKWLPG